MPLVVSLSQFFRVCARKHESCWTNSEREQIAHNRLAAGASRKKDMVVRISGSSFHYYTLEALMV